MTLIDKYNKQALRYLKDGTYQNLQRTNTWKNGRAEVLRIRKNKGKCEKCGRSAKTLYMHHRKYDMDHLFDPKNIRFVCRKCNARIHYRKWTK